MPVSAIEQDIIRYVKQLPPRLQQRVRDFAEALVRTQPKKALTKEEILQVARSFDPADLEEMAAAIREDHEQQRGRTRAG